MPAEQEGDAFSAQPLIPRFSLAAIYARKQAIRHGVRARRDAGCHGIASAGPDGERRERRAQVGRKHACRAAARMRACSHGHADTQLGTRTSGTPLHSGGVHGGSRSFAAGVAAARKAAAREATTTRALVEALDRLDEVELAALRIPKRALRTAAPVYGSTSGEEGQEEDRAPLARASSTTGASPPEVAQPLIAAAIAQPLPLVASLAAVLLGAAAAALLTL